MFTSLLHMPALENATNRSIQRWEDPMDYSLQPVWLLGPLFSENGIQLEFTIESGDKTTHWTRSLVLKFLRLEGY
jgi:hypothetical protein